MGEKLDFGWDKAGFGMRKNWIWDRGKKDGFGIGMGKKRDLG